MALRPRRTTARIVCDSLLTVIVIVIYIVLTKVVRPSVRGFFCDDESINYPYKSDTVPAWMLFVTMFLAVPLSIAFVELYTTSHRLRAVRHHQADSQRPQAADDDLIITGLNDGPTDHRTGPNSSQPSFVRLCCRQAGWSFASILGLYAFGLVVTLWVTEVGKLTIGRLRPHFFAICQPDFTTLNCSLGYVQNYECSPLASPARVWEARKSFPSGHSSMAVFTAVFIGYYFRRRLVTECTLLTKMVVDVLLCSLATFTCLSRVVDNKHHWSDVLGGALVGLVIAVWIIIFMRRAITWDAVRPIANGDDITHLNQPINASNELSQPCVVYTDSET